MLVAMAALGTGCASGSTPDPAPAPPGRGPSPDLATGATTTSASKVLVVIEENHTAEEMRDGMPFLARLSDTYGYATHWTAITHPSEPNYLAIAGGSTFGIRDDESPTTHASDVGDAPSVFDQALAAGRTAATYAESMPDNCDVHEASDQEGQDPTYAVRHNPWVFFGAGREGCLAHDVSLEPFAGDAAHNALPDVGFLIPNLDHDAHDGSLGAADAWLEEQLTPVLRSSDFTSGRLVVVVTADRGRPLGRQPGADVRPDPGRLPRGRRRPAHPLLVDPLHRRGARGGAVGRGRPGARHGCGVRSVSVGSSVTPRGLLA